MANFYIDTEFVSYSHKPLFERQRQFIDLISIGITDDTGVSYYGICNEFNLREAWYQWQEKDGTGENRIRNNVLHSVYKNLEQRAYYANDIARPFSYSEMKRLLKEYGSSVNKIAAEVVDWVHSRQSSHAQLTPANDILYTPIQFYGYYADYDWVLFCSLFGGIMDLPKSFPIYCRDLKQMLDMKLESMDMTYKETMISNFKEVRNDLTAIADMKDKLFWAKNLANYPQQTSEHNALSDAGWNKELHDFILTLK